MSRTELHNELANATGEDLKTINKLGFQLTCPIPLAPIPAMETGIHDTNTVRIPLAHPDAWNPIAA